MCDAHIRAFRPINDTTVNCNKTDDHHHMHEGVLVDYAYPGSRTIMRWAETDRRNFHGEWPGQCIKSPACNLPNGHHGSCNVD